MATKLGYASYNAMVTAAAQGQTIIDGGYLRTALIDVENILTKNITVKDNGVIHSSNYNGTIDANGNITGYGSAGWAIDHSGRADFNAANIQSPTRITHEITTPLIDDLYNFFLDLDIEIANYNPYKIVGEFIYRTSNTSQYVFNAQYLYKMDSSTFKIYGQLYAITNGQIIDGQMQGDLQYYGYAYLDIGQDDIYNAMVSCNGSGVQFSTKLDFQEPCRFSL